MSACSRTAGAAPGLASPIPPAPDRSLSFGSTSLIQASIAATPGLGLTNVCCVGCFTDRLDGQQLRLSPAPPPILSPGMVDRYSPDHDNPLVLPLAAARLPATATTIAGPGVAPRRNAPRSHSPALKRLGDPRRGRLQGRRASGSSRSSWSGSLPTRVIRSGCRPLGRAAAPGAVPGSWRFSGASAAGRCHGSVASGWRRRAKPGSGPAHPIVSVRWPSATAAAISPWSVGISPPLAGCGSPGWCRMSAVGLVAVAAWMAIRSDWRADRLLVRVDEKAVGIKADFAACGFDYCSALQTFCRSADRGGS